jgi:hypothetical protein
MTLLSRLFCLEVKENPPPRNMSSTVIQKSLSVCPLRSDGSASFEVSLVLKLEDYNRSEVGLCGEHDPTTFQLNRDPISP